MKINLGLDIGTNSIGWAIVETTDAGKPIRNIAAGSRIIPMSQDILGNFDSGQSHSQTAERTNFRSIRKVRERSLLRRERLHRVLNILGFLPEHYSNQIDFEKKLGQFIPGSEPKLSYHTQFIFANSYAEMLLDFSRHQPALLAEGRIVPHAWTIYYLRKKALTEKIEKEELAWLLLNFNQKRGYYQLRGEEEDETPNKLVEFHTFNIVDVQAAERKKNEEDTWYNIQLENGWVYRRTSRAPLDWIGKRKEFIVTTELNSDGTIKLDKDGKEKRSFRAPDENDWTLLKKKAEYDLSHSSKTVGAYIYDTLLQNPNQKIKGKLIRTIEREFYKTELQQILHTQKKFHPALNGRKAYSLCIEELYRQNELHKHNIRQKDFSYLFVDDIIFYQRPLKSKKSLISNCNHESKLSPKGEVIPVKCIPKSHPLFQEFRLWQFIQNLRIYEKDTDVNITDELLKSEQDWERIFEWLNDRKDIEQKILLKQFFKLKKPDEYRWNYVEDKAYPCNETRSQILARLSKVESVPVAFLTKENEEALWHILYSVEDRVEIQKALKTFAQKKELGDDFAETFKKFPPYVKDYGAFSAKAIGKLLSLMRIGKYWQPGNIHPHTLQRIDKITTGEYDESIKDRVRDKAISLKSASDFKGLPLWLASYIVYDRHSEDKEALQWRRPSDISLLPQHSLRNPIVEKVINETLLVVKDIWNGYGHGKEGFFHEIHVELGREMKNPAKKREQMTKQVIGNENTNLRIKALLAELMNDPNVENVRPYSPMQQEILKIYEEGVLHAENDIPEDISKIARQSQLTTAELSRYKIWLQQKYRSPYTGKIIPLNKLFTRAYDIEHIIPQSRYFDDSFSNKVICEVEVNKDKDKNTAYEYIKNNGGKIMEASYGEKINILTVEQYEHLVKNSFSKNRSKLKKLLSEDIPEVFIERQLNDTRYISKVVKNLLSNIVREDNEQETVSKNVISSNGNITAALKQDWGLNDVWNDIITPRFERLNEMTQSSRFGKWVNKEGKLVFQTELPLEHQKGFNRKRIDHRHHALDAIVVACTSRNHINYLNNESAIGKGRSKAEKEKKRYDLKHTLCFKKYNDDTNYKWAFHKPWESFTQDTGSLINDIIVSFKQNVRVINKTNNRYQGWIKNENGELKKGFVRQTKGDNWAIRKPLHKDTIQGLIQLQLKKIVSTSAALKNWEMIVDKDLKSKIKEWKALGQNPSVLLKEQGISRIEIYYWDKEIVATRVKIDESFDSNYIDCITDTGIRKILRAHLAVFNEIQNGKIIEHPELAFSPDGLDALNKEILALNDGKPHQPILKVRTFEPKGNKFNVGQTGNKKDKYVEAAKGTNLFFGVYQDEKGKRVTETIPLHVVIERQKHGLKSVPEINESGDRLLFHLSPNDLVYFPTEEELANWNGIGEISVDRVYKVVSFSGSRLSCLPNAVAKSIIDKFEFTKRNKIEGVDKVMIKNVCFKLVADRLGKVKLCSAFSGEGQLLEGS
ncbi:type II CRISPR RNA-guided endonuclease Cas9 [Chitinophaga sp. SYP-B3965]|uniref:type II CRISPR RNA-guided endonuclease Cas9 n=1 Tax=Chitinophaga sp. SYP-B3965 TaxID=2663120 RepID=UPI0012995889|nr:type II CRISPR RNA-guided endonuclease Cas9 [Chitinophaga sp. SYP-B3965]MRG48259.1 type II CRISPR RNA-guided endonuclease Cas9 [Chitinophaga sp. SYP-B3965]